MAARYAREAYKGGPDFFAEETTARIRTDPRAERFARTYLTFAFHPLRPVGLSHAHARIADGWWLGVVLVCR